jgi:hypothetical protein
VIFAALGLIADKPRRDNVAKAAGDVISGLLNTPLAIIERATVQL